MVPMVHLGSGDYTSRYGAYSSKATPHDKNYQPEIALRQRRAKKNKIDGIRSTPDVRFADLIAFVAVMNVLLGG
jgi:hypothetical protein